MQDGLLFPRVSIVTRISEKPVQDPIHGSLLIFYLKQKGFLDNKVG